MESEPPSSASFFGQHPVKDDHDTSVTETFDELGDAKTGAVEMMESEAKNDRVKFEEFRTRESGVRFLGRYKIASHSDHTILGIVEESDITSIPCLFSDVGPVNVGP